MGKKIVAVKPRPDPKITTGKKRDRTREWKPCEQPSIRTFETHLASKRRGRNPLLEQMIPMPPATHQKGRWRGAREATFDPLRGGFILLAEASSYDPEKDLPQKRGGLKPLLHLKDSSGVKAIMSQAMPQVEGENKSPDLPLLHKRRAPEGTQFDNDLRMGLQLHDMSTAEKCVMWNKYQKALERSLRRDGDVEGITWRHRATKEPAPEVYHHPHRRLFKATSAKPFGTSDEYDDDGCPIVPSPPPKSGRRTCPATAKGQGDYLLNWEIRKGEMAKTARPRNVPPSFGAGPHMDDMMDDERSSKLAAPSPKQRRHIPVCVGGIDSTISPADDTERRKLNAREVHELTTGTGAVNRLAQGRTLGRCAPQPDLC